MKSNKNKKIIVNSSTCLLICFLITSCASTFKDPKQIDRDGVDTIFYSEGVKATYVKKQGNPERYCAAREGDVVETGQNNISFGLGMAGKTESISDQSGQQALALGGRNPAVLITRELMYRACELSANINASSEHTIDIYKMFLQSLDQIFQQDQEPGTGSSTLALSESQAQSDEDDVSDDLDEDGDKEEDEPSDTEDDDDSDE